MICPKCGERIPDDSVFCQECGYKLESDRKKRCEICGTYNDWDAMFCERCGQPLEDEEPETAEKGNRIQGKTIVLCGIFYSCNYWWNCGVNALGSYAAREKGRKRKGRRNC